jgi:RND family efflux transporter MFP subunit
LNASRARRLIGSSSIGKEEYDQVIAAREKAVASVGAAQAAVDRAELYLNFTEIRAPVTGRISRRYVDPKNLVKADDTVLTTVVADEPVYAYFDVDERTYLDLVGESPTAVADARLKALKIPVLMRLANGEDFTYPGYVDFLDNRLNGNTGTIRLRAVFPNPRDNLKAGLFVRIRLPIGKPYPALFISDEAVQSDQGRKFVYVVHTVTETKEDGSTVTKDVVEYRPVALGQAVKGLRVIQAAKKGADGKLEGLERSDRVVVRGMQRVRDGIVVTAKEEPPPKAPGSSLIQLLSHRDTETPKK